MGYLMLDDWARITMGAAVCMLVEAMPIGDDNFAIPIATATAVTVTVGW